MGIALCAQERRGIRHNLKMEVREIGVAAVADFAVAAAAAAAALRWM